MYDSKQPTKDEKQIKDFMVAKYEKKKYYSDPGLQNEQNGIQSSSKPPSFTAVTTTTYQVIILAYFIDMCCFFYMHTFIYLQKPSNDVSSPAINTSSSNKFEFFKEEPHNQNQSPIQTSQSFANFDNNPAFSTCFDTTNFDTSNFDNLNFDTSNFDTSDFDTSNNIGKYYKHDEVKFTINYKMECIVSVNIQNRF